MLSKRERLIGILTVVILAALVGDRFILTPATRSLGRLEDNKQQLLAELNEAQNLFQRRRLMERKWQKSLGEGLKSESEAESHILHALDGWARQSRLTLTSVKPERMSEIKNGLQEMTFTIAGTGSLQATAQFLYQVETGALPIKIKDMQLGSANEMGNDMSIQLGLSALYVNGQDAHSEPDKNAGGKNEQDG